MIACRVVVLIASIGGLGCGSTVILGDGDSGVAVGAGGATECDLGGAPPSGAGDAPPYGCFEALPGPAMVEAQMPSGEPFCIDATEVTYADYAEFLAAVGPTPCEGTSSPLCRDNASFEPWYGWPPAEDGLDRPVGWTDWCDALAYCRWTGKRLCYDAAPDDSAEVSEWWSACTRAGERKYPYGDVFTPGACVEGVADEFMRVSGSTPSCEGGFDGLFDMLGNASEWSDFCGAPAAGGDAGTECVALRGSNFLYQPHEREGCDQGAVGGEVGYFIYVAAGIRCCRDARPR